MKSRRLMMDRPALEAMGAAAKSMAKPLAAQKAADVLMELWVSEGAIMTICTLVNTSESI